MVASIGICLLLALGIVSCMVSTGSTLTGEDGAPDLIYCITRSARPRHCADLLGAGQKASGLYNIFPLDAEPSGQIVYCDIDTDGGGWTVIQKLGQLGNSVYYFYRNWTEYTNGFGDPAKEYWIGNKALHALTSGTEDMSLKIQLQNHTGERASVDYMSFRVAGETDFFKLTLGAYIGPIGWDALDHGKGCAFSTFDRDHDNSSKNCALLYRGAWWYNQCHEANLNGLNLNGPHTSYADGIEWSRRGGHEQLHYYSYPSAGMMIRPVKRSKCGS